MLLLWVVLGLLNCHGVVVGSCAYKRSIWASHAVMCIYWAQGPVVKYRQSKVCHIYIDFDASSYNWRQPTYCYNSSMQPVLLQSSAFLEVSVTHMAAKCVEFVFNMIKELSIKPF